MKRRASLVTALACSLVAAVAAAGPPRITAAAADLQTSLLVIRGDFDPGKKAPSVLLGNELLSVEFWSAGEIHATLPANLPPASYLLAVTTDGKDKFDRCDEGKTGCFGVAIGAVGPRGPAGASVVAASEPAGRNCAWGGSSFTASGQTTYACNGAPGPQGPPGAGGGGVPGNCAAGQVLVSDGRGGWSCGDVCSGLFRPVTFVNLRTDPNNCGSCYSACSLAHASAACTAGACTVAACSPGYGDCDRIAANGCEVNLGFDARNCGGCGVVCGGNAPLCTNGQCSAQPIAKRVFVTSQLYTGNLGGVDGADAKCQGLADGRALGGTWKAWLGDDTHPLAQRFTRASQYVLLNGTVIANGWDDLLKGSISSPINVNEQGGGPPVGSGGCDTQNIVWSNVGATGDQSATYCGQWTNGSNGAGGCRGLASNSNYLWASGCCGPCDYLAGLYCFEQ